MVEHKPSKLDTRVRFPPPAIVGLNNFICANGSVVEHRLAKARVASSNLVSRFPRNPLKQRVFAVFKTCIMVVVGIFC